MPIDLDRLKITLLTSGLQQRDKPLFQVIDQLIQSVREHTSNANASINGSGGGGGLTNLSYFTKNNDRGTAPNSIRLLAGVNVTFDDSVIGDRTINVSSAAGGYWSPLTDGDVIETDLIFANGDAIMVFVPIP